MLTGDRARRLVRLLVRCVALVIVLCARPAHAGEARRPAHGKDTDALDVAQNLRGVELGPKLLILEDTEGKLDIRQVVTAPAARFRRTSLAAPTFGFTSSAYWLKLEVENTGSEQRSWLLELAYPLLDDVKLYVPQDAGGFALRATGDTRPFRQRDLAYRNFVFTLEEPAHGARAYYLRVQTRGSMTLPLVAWTFKEFLEHQHLDWAVLCVFYGVVLIMAMYNAFLGLFSRQREYLPYAAYISMTTLYQSVGAGHAFQFLLPEQPALLHHLQPVFGALALLFAAQICESYLHEASFFASILKYVRRACCALSLISFVAPYAWNIKLLAVLAGVLLLNLFAAIIYLYQRRSRQAWLLLLGWASIMVGALVTMGLALGVLPAAFLTTWSVQIGLSIQVVLLASALADKINTARAELSALNVALSSELEAVSLALRTAEEASQRAEGATRVRDEFIATMSHEFRTPLNPIINIPQGLREEFVRAHHVQCTHCQARFELEPNEVVSGETPCPDCQVAGVLHEESALRYAGNASRARTLLTKVEHAGEHLLRIVNGILDYSRMEAQQLKLVCERLDAAALVRGLVSELGESARSAEIQLTCAVGDRPVHVQADPQRLREVLSHLIDNALKFRRGPGAVTVSLREEAGRLMFSVVDQGIGIAQEHLATVFTSFEQVSKGNTRSHGGTGLGLSMARSLVRMHGGDISVRSTLGVGSTFQFWIPRSPPSSSLLLSRAAGARS